MASAAIVVEKALSLFELAVINTPLLFERWKKMVVWQFLHVARPLVCHVGSLVINMSDLIYCQPRSIQI